MNRSIMRGMEGAQAHLFDMKTLNSQEDRLIKGCPYSDSRKGSVHLR
jgi:hypothetical protein